MSAVPRSATISVHSAQRFNAMAPMASVACAQPGADRAATRAALLAQPGIGEWTADYLLMRAVGDPDVLLDSDLGVRKAAKSLDIEISNDRLDWAPWRSYATHQLWATLH